MDGRLLADGIGKISAAQEVDDAPIEAAAVFEVAQTPGDFAS